MMSWPALFYFKKKKMKKLRLEIYKEGKKVLPIILMYLQVLYFLGWLPLVVSPGCGALLLLDAVREGRCMLFIGLCLFLTISGFLSGIIPGIIGMTLVILVWQKFDDNGKRRRE